MEIMNAKNWIFITTLLSSVNLYAQVVNPACGNWGTTQMPSLNCNSFESGDWVLVFNDEFERDHIDQSKWHTLVDGWNHEHGDELQYYLEDNIIMKDGVVELTAEREPDYYDVWRWDENGNGYITQKYFEYTSGYLETKMKYKQGFFEIRCRIPEGKGFWPAFWLWGYDEEEDLGTEIDVFEFAGAEPNKHAMNLHKWVGQSSDDCATKRNYGIDFSAGFHTFSIEWDEFKIVYRVDGDIKRIDYKWINASSGIGLYDCQSHSPAIYKVNPLYPTKSASVILNLAISCDGCPFGGPPNSSTDFPSALEIDYIRIYKRNNENKNISICNFDYDSESSIVTGKTITVGGISCDLAIEDSESLHLYATDRISLLPGFHAKFGSNVSGHISTAANSFKSGYSNNYINEGKEINISSNDDDVFSENFYTIFPNPSNGQFSIKFEHHTKDIQRIELVDMNGKLIHQLSGSPGNPHTIDISDYAKGCYLLRIITTEKLYVNQIILQ